MNRNEIRARVVIRVGGGNQSVGELVERAGDLAALTGKTFFPQLISQPFHSGLVIVFVAAAIMSVIGAIASVVMGGKFVHVDTAAVTMSGSRADEQPADALSDV